MEWGTESSEGKGALVSVMLIVPDGAAAVEWYKTALGAGELWNLGGVAGLHLDGAPFFLHEAVPGRSREPSPGEVGLTTTRIEVFVDDPGSLIARAAEGGATEVDRPTDRDVPWGAHRQGGFTDPFGHRWSVGDRTPLARFPR
ncbi:MAG TPA: VOC family protein [Solirubrobacteraceae bacterium]|nr:VOC family protein [Solirubrobacteraceae bacterium]